jgi:hypothetical protein
MREGTKMKDTDVRSMLESNLKERNLSVSDVAVKILVECILAIEQDPEPAWRDQPVLRNLDAVQRDAIFGITMKLAKLSNSREVRSREGEILHTYGILHHISRWIDQLCPFEKPVHRRIIGIIDDYE